MHLKQLLYYKIGNLHQSQLVSETDYRKLSVRVPEEVFCVPPRAHVP